MNNVALKYSYQVGWSSEDDAYVARCSEMPGIAGHGDTAQAALKSVEEAATGAVECILEDGETPPMPLCDYSGKFMVRIPPHLHRDLAMEAGAHKISMNRLISAKLASTSFKVRTKSR